MSLDLAISNFAISDYEADLCYPYLMSPFTLYCIMGLYFLLLCFIVFMLSHIYKLIRHVEENQYVLQHKFDDLLDLLMSINITIRAFFSKQNTCTLQHKS